MGVELTDRARLLPRSGKGRAARLCSAAELLLRSKRRRRWQLSLVFVDDAEMRALNRGYRGRGHTTDVLAFAQGEGERIAAAGEAHLGDVVISVPTAAKQAREGGWTLEQELLRLLVHGFLHLLGLDHAKSRREALRMRAEENRLCRLLERAGFAPAYEREPCS